MPSSTRKAKICRRCKELPVAARKDNEIAHRWGVCPTCCRIVMERMEAKVKEKGDAAP